MKKTDVKLQTGANKAFLLAGHLDSGHFPTHNFRTEQNETYFILGSQTTNRERWYLIYIQKNI